MSEKEHQASEELDLNNLAILSQKLQRTDFNHDEWKLIEGVDLGGIDLSLPENQYQLQIIEGLLSKYHERSVFLDVVNQLKDKKSSLEKVQFLKIRIDDLGNKIGTKREVDLIKLTLQNGEDLHFTASLDIHALEQEDNEDSPSAREVKNLTLLNSKGVQSVQQLFGSRTLEVEDDYSEEPMKKTLICKEYLPGDMLELYLTDIDYTISQIGEDSFRSIAYQTGYAFQEPVTKTGHVIKDSNPLNFIVGQKNDKGFVRYCDCDSISSDPRETAMEMRLLRSRFGKFMKEFDKGCQDAKELE